MAIVEIPSEYGYVLLAATSSAFVNIWHMAKTGNARKASGIAYPIAYATEEQAKEGTPAYTFNCAQRAHANYTENLTPFLTTLLIGGLGAPLAAAGLGFAWLAARVAYTIGYTSPAGPKGRITGAYANFFCGLGLTFTAVYTSAKIILA